MAGAGQNKSFANLSDGGDRLPIPPLALEPLPIEIVKAFPAMADWEKKTNQRYAEWVNRVNTVIGRIL